MFIESGSVVEDLREGRRTGLLTLAGQDFDWRANLLQLRRGRVDLTAWSDQVLSLFAERLAADPTVVPSLALSPTAPTAWLDDLGDDAAIPSWSTEPSVLLPCTALGQLCAIRVLADIGAAPGEGLDVVTGHSAGLGAAWLAARHGVDVPVDAAVDLLMAFAIVGDESTRHPWALGGATGSDSSVAMLAVAGLSEPALREALDAFRPASDHVPSDGIDVALQNSWDRLVLSGDPVMVERFARLIDERPGVRTEVLDSRVPFHHRNLADTARAAIARIRSAGIRFDGATIVPVVDPRDGNGLGATVPVPVVGTGAPTAQDSADTEPAADRAVGDVTADLVESWIARPVRWADTLVDVVSGLRDRGTGSVVVLDPGPSTTTAVLSRRALAGTGTTVLGLGDDGDVRALMVPSARPGDPVDYASFAPGVRRGADGRDRLHTRHSDWSGRPPVILAGMTPTTVDVDIVAAATNAGHLAELAGGGQVSPTIFDERMVELAEALDAGMEVVFNALVLDPYLWDLHLGRTRLVQNARSAGAPICGVTFSAGTPDLDRAVELLDELSDLGIWLNSFKVGDDRGITDVLRIADATPHRIWLHLEGGLAGGHHGAGNLEQLLVRNYARIRERDNVALVVGGGIATPDRVADLLDGSWALPHARIDMPVDAVLIGTAAMASAEARTSPQVKAALVEAVGTDEPVAAGTVDGGVTSGLSSLGAPIHYLDNHASRVAAMLHDLAADESAITGRRQEIIDALAGTAKPFFGELDEMSYIGVLERFVELTAIGRHGRYEDGAWLDPTHRQLFADLLDRFDARCCDRDEGLFDATFDEAHHLDDPVKTLEIFRAAHPVTCLADVEPSDVAFVVDRCDRTPKPVPFVIAIDQRTRRRYLADSLWYSHDDRFTADQVLVVPGPAALAGITRVDEPVVDLLDRFGSVALDRATASTAGSAAGSADRSVGVVPAVEWLTTAPTLVTPDGPATSVIRRMARGAGWETTVDTTTATMTARMSHGEETLTLTGPLSATGTVQVEVSWPPVPTAEGDGSLSFLVHVEESAGVRVGHLDTESLETAQRGLLAMMVGAASTRAGGALGGDDAPDASMMGVWGTVFELMETSGLAGDLTRLLHTRHVIGHDDDPSGTGPGLEVSSVGDDAEIHTTVGVDGLLCQDVFRVLGAGARATLTSTSSTAVASAVAASAEASRPGDGPRVDTPRSTLGRHTSTAPQDPTAFAVLSGDLNPLHRSDLVARSAGLDSRIVHGMWTSVMAQRLALDTLVDGDPTRLRRWDMRFLAAVLPGDRIEVTFTRVGMRGGRRVVEVDVRGPDGPVASGEVEIDGPRTAYVFPGQGIQHQGMGRAERDRSDAARAVWSRAESFCSEELGFSLVEVVDENPSRIMVDDGGVTVEHRHPAGVLNLTQFTQVAMATLAASQVAEMRESGVFDESAVLAGHSVGEYNALAAIGDVIPLEAVLGLVWARGSAMHRLVPRDDRGASRYRLAAIRPHLAGLDERGAIELVQQVESDSGELCAIVNHNLRDRQYAVAGTLDALDLLRRRLGSGNGGGRSPYIEVPGIDVPFHSRALAGGVEEFRQHLDAVLPLTIDHSQLVGRYVPNLYPHPFSLERGYVEAVGELCDEATALRLDAAYRGCDEAGRSAEASGLLARTLLIELLAWQFASPVRWIETTELMLRSTDADPAGLGVRRVVEVGVGSAPTITNLTKAAVAADGSDTEVFNIEIDRDVVLEMDEDPFEWDPEQDWDGDAPGPLLPDGPDPVSAPDVVSPEDRDLPTGAGVEAVEVSDAPVDRGDSVRALIAFSTGLRLDQLGDDSIDELVDGASSRRNQVLLDLGKNLGLGAIDGAHEIPLSQLIERLADLVPAHRHPGPVLDTMIRSGVSAAAAQLGVSPSKLLEPVRSVWRLGPGWVQQCELEIALATRSGTSRRGGELATLTAEDPTSMIDDVIETVGARLGVPVGKPAATAGAATVDAAIVGELAGAVVEVFDEAASTARAVLAARGVGDTATSDTGDDPDRLVDADSRTEMVRLADLDAEHGVDRAEAVRPIFDPERVVLFDSSVARARADLDRLVESPPCSDEEFEDLVVRLARFSGHDERFDETTQWYAGTCAATTAMTGTSAGTGTTAGIAAGAAAGIAVTTGTGGTPEGGVDPRVPAALERIMAGRLDDDAPLDVAGRVVLVSGASPGSIAESTVATLLGSGAHVVVLTSSTDPERRRAWRALERHHGAPGAALTVAPANLASFGDIDSVIEWLASDPEGPGLPDVIVPFAAPRVLGDASDTGPAQELELRVMLLGVERLVSRCAQAVGRSLRRPVGVVLPMSPNHGIFGGDGAYGHAKAGLEVLVNRRRSEADRWGRWCRIVSARIGWVRGTGLMGAQDTIAPLVEDTLGIRTFSAEEMGRSIAGLCVPDGTDTTDVDVEVDLTGGLGDIDPATFATVLRALTSDREPTGSGSANGSIRRLWALPTPSTAGRRHCGPVRPTELDLDEMVVICGVGEIGPWGTGSTRADAERDRDLGARSVIALASASGLVEWSSGADGGRWVDAASGEAVEEADIAARYRDAVLARCGIRETPGSIESRTRVFGERPVSVVVGSRAEAERLVAVIAGATSGERDGTHYVTLPAGSSLFVEHDEPLPRRVGAPIPDGMAPSSFGVPEELVAQVDPAAAWLMATTAEAFRDSGTDPGELTGLVGTSRVACTIGTGMGGMDSIRTLHMAPRHGLPHANDVLQEALGNVPAAHVVQSYVGSTGPMIHPVAACATAGVSLELATDLIRSGKADAVVGGGYDDIGAEGIIGFAEMAATADDAAMRRAGYSPREMSRPGDRRRAGFIESQGGGTFVVTRASVAVELGLPVRAVVVFANSYGDGLATSIPAPGDGALASVEGDDASPLAIALRRHGLGADDIAVVSKHDTSTRANDPNEAMIHEEIQRRLGRTPGNPLRVISQKSITGHSKGGSALWQIAGLCDVFDDAVVPGNPNLDSVDAEVQKGPWLVVDDDPLELRTAPRAAMFTSLGFGHVSVVGVLAHPDLFEGALRDRLGDEALGEYRHRSARRRRSSRRDQRWAVHGVRLPYERRSRP